MTPRQNLLTVCSLLRSSRMSRLRLKKKDLQKVPVGGQTPPRSAYNLFPSSPHSSSPTKRAAKPIVYLPNGQTLSQRVHLPIPRGQVGFLERPNNNNNDNKIIAPDASDEIHDVFGGDAGTFLPQTPHSRKRLAQSARWHNKVVPALITPYMNYLRKSSNLTEEITAEPLECVCLNDGLELEVVVLHFNSACSIVCGVPLLIDLRASKDKSKNMRLPTCGDSAHESWIFWLRAFTPNPGCGPSSPRLCYTSFRAYLSQQYCGI